jgi:predicted Zn-dependent protease
MCLRNAIERTLLKAALVEFIVTMSVSSVAQSYQVGVYQSDARPWTTSTTQASGRSQPFKISHDASIRVNSAVGSHNNGCTRGLGNQYSLKAQEMGRSHAQQVDTISKLITDPVIGEYVNRIAQNLARNSEIQVQLTLKIIDTDEVNAFSLPGGFIFVDSGLILAADNEAELAGVISHEIAHVAACHAAQEMAQTELTNLGSMPLILRFVFRPFTRNTIYSKPTRSFESEADLFGVEYLYKAGYDPQALLSILEKIKAIEKQETGNRVNAFESRSLTTDRIARTRQKINALRYPAREYRVNTPDFQAIKARLSELDKVSITELILH